MGDHEGVSAIVEELSSKRQLFLRLHDQIPDIGEISEIRRDGMVVRQGDQQELLELAASQIEKPPAAPVAAAHQPLLQYLQVQRVPCSIEESLSKPWTICPSYYPRREPCLTS